MGRQEFLRKAQRRKGEGRSRGSDAESKALARWQVRMMPVGVAKDGPQGISKGSLWRNARPEESGLSLKADSVGKAEAEGAGKSRSSGAKLRM